MAGTEREFMSKMDSMMAPPREQQQDPVTFLEATQYSMRDFWRLNTGTSDHRPESHQLQPAPDHHVQESGVRGGQAIADMHRLGEYSLRPYSYGAPQGMEHQAASESSHVVPMGVHHDVYYTNLCHPAYPPGDPYNPSSSNSALVSAHATYTNFFNPGSCSVDRNDNNDSMSRKHETPTRYMPSTENHYDQNSSFRPSNATTMNQVVYSSSVSTHGTLTSSENINRDMESLRRELAFKCPRSNDLLMAITSTAEATVQEHGTVDDDDDDPPPPRLFPLSELEQDLEVRAAIVEHPYYPELVVAHIKIFKIGAPKGLRNKLDDITKEFQRFQEGNTTRIGDDPSLDFFMRSYVDLLGKLGEDMEEPFNKFMQFKDSTTKQLEDICGHYIETGPDETDNYGYGITTGPMDGTNANEELDKMKEDQSMIYSYNDIDESIVIDASLPDEELRKKLMQKYGRHIGGLKAEFNRVRKKGKLPSQARNVLKDWFNRHSYWPYPSEAEKQYLQRMCFLNLKQINNWFINERKRHWSCEGKCMHPNTKFYNSSDHCGDEGRLE